MSSFLLSVHRQTSSSGYFGEPYSTWTKACIEIIVGGERTARLFASTLPTSAAEG
nr:hypothetical protein [Methylorubrum zatmanii]